MARKELIKYLKCSNIVIGQFLYGILSLTEIEALALQDYVIMGPLRAITRSAYKTHIPVIEIGNVQDLISFFSSIPSSPNLEGRLFAKEVSDPLKIARNLLKSYSKYVEV